MTCPCGGDEFREEHLVTAPGSQPFPHAKAAVKGHRYRYVCVACSWELGTEYVPPTKTRRKAT